jgi:TP901 family phage tail tape measure protein
MADIQANIGIGVDNTQALAAIRQLQREISAFHTSMAKGGALANAESARLSQNLVNTINAGGKFSASMTNISSSTESFTNALEKNKLSMGQYFRYAGGASKSFGKMFTREFDTINRVATERVKDLQTQYISMGREANGALQAIRVRPLALDMDNLGTKVMLASQKQQVFNQLLRQGTTNLLNFGKNTQWAGRQLMVGFTIPLTIFGAAAANEFKKIEEQVVKFRRVYGDMFNTDAETEKALKNIRELADEFTKYGIAVEKTIGLAAKVAQMGNVGTALTEQVTQATRLAVLGGLEQEEALDTTISLTNAFGIAAENLADKIAFLNAAENQTILSIEDFNTAIPLAGSVVQQLGGDVEDLAFFLTAMREGGINASQGANALKTSLARLVAPTEVAKKEMAGFGIDIVGIVEQNAGNLRNTIMVLGQELDKLDPLNRARAIEQLFGKFQFARMSTMFQNISRDGSQANKVLELTTASTAELAVIAERELKKVEESPAFKLEKQMEKLRASLAPIGEEFIKAVGPLIEFGTKLLKSFNSLGDGGKQFIVILTAVAGVIAPAALMAFGLIANGVANLLKLFAFLGRSFGMLSGKSTLLGGQTEYMTQQQLEAAAVAASLSQSHNNLTQIFTAEASAIRNLTAAYQQAVIAQAAFRGSGVATGARGARPAPKPSINPFMPPKLATGGIIRGPGTGTSDSIMAMLSNGEAVIPAKQVKKYGTVVEQLITGNIPGYRFGFNPFGMMLGQSRVAARMPQSSLMSMISQGPGARYSNAFKTQTGADYQLPGGGANPKQRALRSQMEEDVFGIGQSAGADARPTYGYARISPIQAILNRIFGLKGKQFNAVTFGKKIGDIGSRGLVQNRDGKWVQNPSFRQDQLKTYGDVDVVAKRSVSRRSSAIAGDALIDYRDSQQYGRRSPYFAPAPMRGATPEQIAKAMFDNRIGKPFGPYKPDPINNPNMYSNNIQPGYIETHTPGGFGINEISRIIAKDKTAKKAIQEALSASGLKIRVTDQNFATKLFKALGISGFEDGTFSVPGPKGAGDVVPAMLAPGEAVIPAAMAKKYAPFINSIIADNVPGYQGGKYDMPSVGPGETRGYTNAVALFSREGNSQASKGIQSRQDALSELNVGGQAIFAPILSEIARRLGATSQQEIEAMVSQSPEFSQFAQNISAGMTNAIASKTGDVSDPELYAAADAQRPSVTGGFSKEFTQAADEVFDSVTVVENNAQKRLNESRTRLKSMGRQNISTEDVAYDSRESQYKALAATLPGTLPEDPVLAHLTQNKVGTVEELLSGRTPTQPTKVLGERLSQGVEVVRDSRTGTSFEVEPGAKLADAKSKIEEMESLGQAAGEGLVQGVENSLQIASPSKRMFNLGQNAGDSLADGFEQAMSDEGRAKPPLPGNLEAPKPPVTPEVPQSKAGKLFSNLKSKAGTIGNKAMDAALETGPGRKVANYFAETSGANITNSQGKVVSTLHQEIKELGDAADRAADQVEENTQAVKENGQASSKGAKSDIAKDNAGNPIIGPDGKPLTNKQVKGEAKRQGRQRRASVAAGIMGTATMAAGMATQVDAEVFGFNIGEMAQKIMPVVGALAILGPMLLAMSGPVALLVLVIGGLVAGYMLYQKKLKEITEAARELAESLGSGSKAMGRFAEFAGKATPTEIMNEQRQLGEINVAMGKSEFGENFVASDQGKEFMETIEKGFSEIGRSDTMTKMGVQLATAVSGNILTAEEAAGIAAEVGREMGDLSISMDLLGNLTELIGPGGQDLLTNPLEVFISLVQATGEDVGQTIQEMMNNIVAPDVGTGFFEGLFTGPELQAQLAGEIIAAGQQIQGVLDAQTVGHQKKMQEYKDENALIQEQIDQLTAQGRIEEANAKREDLNTNNAAILDLENKYWEERAGLLEESKTQNSQLLQQQSKMGDMLSRANTLREGTSGTGQSIEDFRESQRQLLRDYEELTGVTFDFDIDEAGKFTLNDAVASIQSETKEIQKSFQGTLDQMGEVVISGLDENDPNIQRIRNLTTDEEVDYEVRFNLIQGVATGSIDMAQVEKFLDNFPVKVKQVKDDADLIAKTRNDLIESAGSDSAREFYANLSDEEIIRKIIGDNQKIQESFANIVSGLGQGANQQLMNIFGGIDDAGLQEDITTKIGLLVEGGDEEKLAQAQGLLDMFSMISSYGDKTIDKEATMAFYLENPEAFTQFQTQMSKFDAAKEEFGDDLTAEVVLGAVFKADTAEYETFKLQSDYFNSLPAAQQKVFLSTFLTQFATLGAMEGTPEGDEEFSNWTAEMSLADEDFSVIGAKYDDFVAFAAAEAAKKVTAALVSAGVLDDLTIEPEGGGGGAEPQIDSLLKKLRDLRKGTIEMKKGWEGMKEVLASTFANGAMTQFNGLEKQIRNLGVGEGLIAQIVGMDPDEYEKRKSELFEFDNAGNIIKAKAALSNMNEAFDAVAIGEYVNGQEKFIQKTKNQMSAITVLTANGMSLAEAYEAVQDEALAAALAQGASTEEIKEILRVTELAKQMEEDLEAEREKSRISESVRKTNEEFRNQVAVLKELSRAQGQYTDAQIQALMSDQDLQKLMLDPSIDDGALQEALRNAEQKANLEVQINLLTKTGQETEFDKYLAEVNDYFTKEENLINVNFELATADDNKLIEDAQNQIADIQYKLDDYNAELEQISWIEEDINEKYDKRSEALDEIADANEKIANQQKAQLDIADALSRGDIAAAARATAELRSQQIQDAQVTQKDMLDRQREQELAAVRGPGGMTREQLEEEITQLERQIFFIEEQTLEPAQERNRLAEITRDLAIDQLKLNEMTRIEFDKIAAATKQSAINMEDMITSSEKLAALAEFIQTGKRGPDWDRLFPQPKAAAPAPRPSSGGGGGSGGGNKGDWFDPNTGGTIAEAAQDLGYDTWQEYYNENRPTIDPDARPMAFGGIVRKMAMGGLAKKSRSGPPLQMAMGGKVKKYANGGMIIPKRMAMGGYSMGSDIIPAILTPGEFVVRRPAVSAFGVDKLEKINRGTYNDGSVYNYNLAVNVKSDADPNKIANTVMRSIKQVEGRRVRGNRL